MRNDWSTEPDPERIVQKRRLRERVYRGFSTNSLTDPETGEPFTIFDLMTATVGSYDPYLDDFDEVLGWPEDDLAALPEQYRYEIEDGFLQVSPRPNVRHQKLAYQLAKLFEQQCPGKWWPALEVEIRIYEDELITQARSPDLMVIPSSLTTEEANCGYLDPKDVALALEVVSRSSRIANRMTKVALYAEWKIPLYLRLETRPRLALYEYRLDAESGGYRTPVEHTAVFETAEPFPLRIDLGALG